MFIILFFWGSNERRENDIYVCLLRILATLNRYCRCGRPWSQSKGIINWTQSWGSVEISGPHIALTALSLPGAGRGGGGDGEDQQEELHLDWRGDGWRIGCSGLRYWTTSDLRGKEGAEVYILVPSANFVLDFRGEEKMLWMHAFYSSLNGKWERKLGSGSQERFFSQCNQDAQKRTQIREWCMAAIAWSEKPQTMVIHLNRAHPPGIAWMKAAWEEKGKGTQLRTYIYHIFHWVLN